MHYRYGAWFAVIALLGCSSSDPTTDGGLDAAPPSDAGADASPLDGLCPVQHAEANGSGTWVVCDRLYPSAPFIRPPPDTQTDFYVSFAHVPVEAGYGFVMMGRAQSWPEPTGFTSAIEGDGTGHPPYGYTLYRATLTDGNVTGLEPVARIDEKLFLEPFAGATLEGKFSPRAESNGQVSYDYQNPSVPVRIKLDGAVTSDASGAWLGGTIENATSGVYDSSATCMPSLASAGSANPFSGSQAPQLIFTRVVDMHGNHDDVVVTAFSAGAWGSMMTPSGFVSVADLLRTAPLDLASFGGGATHGTPSGSPSATVFAEVTSGGASCQ